MLTVTQNGFGKRTELEEYRVQSRGGIGIINIQTTERNGKVVGMAYVNDDDQLMLISQQGMILRMVAKDVRAIGRATQGVKLIGVEEGDQVVSVAKLAESEDEENGNGGNGGVAVAESEVAPASDDVSAPVEESEEPDTPPVDEE
jgi:DNA gyrase subunit A